MMVKVAPEQSKVRNPAAVPVHRNFAVSLAAALTISGMETIEAYDQMENIADLAMPIEQNRIVPVESNWRKKS